MVHFNQLYLQVPLHCLNFVRQIVSIFSTSTYHHSPLFEMHALLGITQTRMHSSTMRTGRSLIVCCSLLPGGGGVCLVPGGGFLPAQGGVCPETPPVNRITHTCKNITLATTSLRPVITCQYLVM